MKNEKRDILLHLYGEADSESDLRTLLLKSDLKDEHTALSETKFRLDLRKRDRPDIRVIETIMTAARTGDTGSGVSSRIDRGPLQRISRLKKMFIPAVGIAAIILFSVGVGLYSVQLKSNSASLLSASGQNDLVPPESLYRFVPSRQGTISPSGSVNNELSWDDQSTLSTLNGRINTMKPSGLLDWGESAVPLEMLPGSNPRGFQTAGSIRK
jgi:hypothetical protein